MIYDLSERKVQVICRALSNKLGDLEVFIKKHSNEQEYVDATIDQMREIRKLKEELELPGQMGLK